MFARSTWKTADIVEQHRLLCRVADWIDAGELRGTMQEHVRPIDAANLRKAHQKIEGRATIGKIVLSGW